MVLAECVSNAGSSCGPENQGHQLSPHQGARDGSALVFLVPDGQFFQGTESARCNGRKFARTLKTNVGLLHV